MITIELDQQAYAPGSELTGRVTSAVPVESVAVSVAWETSGKGTTDRAVIERQVLPTAQGGGNVYSFKVTLPLLPLSYFGNLLKVTWSITAQTIMGEVTREFLLQWP
jgi:hypothetical protein